MHEDQPPRLSGPCVKEGCGQPLEEHAGWRLGHLHISEADRSNALARRRRQQQMQGRYGTVYPDPDEHLARPPLTAAEEPAQTCYRVTSERIPEDHPGARTITHYAIADSIEDALRKVRDAHTGPGQVLGEDLYRFVRAEDAEFIHREPSPAPAWMADYVTRVTEASIGYVTEFGTEPGDLHAMVRYLVSRIYRDMQIHFAHPHTGQEKQ